MHHVAIMKKSWKLIPKIVSGEKTIESRWYQTRRAPWDKIKAGDTIFFKNGGEPITARATVSEVLQFEIRSIAECEWIVKRYGKEIGLMNKDVSTWKPLPKYCILMRLENPKSVKSFEIDKTGFGNACAWLVVKSISLLRIK